MIFKKTFGLIVLMMILTIIHSLVRPEQIFAETKNLALGKTVSASGNEVEWLFAENAVDGDPASRWSSAIEDDQWLIVNLGKNENISRVVINWQTPAERYKILVSKDKEHWVNVKEDDGVLTAGGKKDTIEFDKAEARYVKFQGVKRRPVEGILYGYSIFEFEVYEDKDPLTEIIKDIREKISIEKGQKEIVLPKTPEGYKVTLYGSDRLPVIDAKGRINKPLVDAKVNLLLQVEDESDPDNKISDNVLVTVPGQHVQTEDLNQEPRVIPSLREWYGRTEKFALAKTSKIVVNKADKDALGRTAELTKNDIKEITNLNLEITYGTPKAGDIYLSLDDSLTSLGEEGSIFDVEDYVSIKSSKVKGVFYGTRTALQILQQDEKHKYIPKGIARDYPKYEDRGFMLDVARKFYSIEFLRDYVKQMSFYKMNRFQIHLNDDVGTPFPDGTKAAFRLESEKYPGLTSKNGFYTKKEFRDLQQLGMDYGINVVPEIDTPGHSGAFIKYDPTLGTANNLDITKPKTVNFVKGLFDEYIDGDNPVFIGPDVHIGTDEYSGNDNEAFRKYMDTLINHINSKGKHPRLWGGLTKHDGETPISNNATMDIWYEPYGGAQHAIDLGYNIVNVYTNLLYIVPQLYADYLNSGYLYNNWEPNNWVETVLPFGHPNVKGAMFALWNDISTAKGVSMADSHHRILPAMQVVSEKMWSGTSADKDFNKFEEDASKIGDAPNVNLSHKIHVGNKDGNVVKYLFEEKFRDSSGNDFDGSGKNVKMADGLFGNGVKFNGGESYIKTPLRSLGFGWTISMWVKPDADNPDDAVLLESPEGQLKLSQGDTGKLGFSKEGYHSVFDYKVPAGEWTHLLLTGDSSGTSLFVNGSKYAESLKDGGKLETFVLPMQRIGSKTNSFKGVIDHVSINNKAVDLHGNLALNKNAESSRAESSTYSSDKAVDGKWDTRWSSASEDDAWFLVDLDEPIEINKVSIAWETAYAKKYKILVSEDKENWTNVIKDNNGIVTGSGGRDNITFDKVKARYVKFQGIERATIFGYSFYEFEIFSDKNLVGNKTDLKNRLTEINSENLKESKYTKESWQHLEQAQQVTEITLNKLDANQAEIDDALAALSKARDGLEEKQSS
ncbi:discoidin domain-containing protein [Bacillus sp. F19]|nr:discoidin domain-containing protein [Bacillus sp. F19]